MLDNIVGNFNTTITTGVSLEKENTAKNNEIFSSMQVKLTNLAFSPISTSKQSGHSALVLKLIIELTSWYHEPAHQKPSQLGDQREPSCLDQLSRAPAALSILVRGTQAGERSEDVVGGESNPHLHQD